MSQSLGSDLKSHVNQSDKGSFKSFVTSCTKVFKSFKKEKSKERLSMDKMTRDTCLNMVRIGSQLHKDTYKVLKTEIKDAKSIYEIMGKKTIVNFKRYEKFF